MNTTKYRVFISAAAKAKLDRQRITPGRKYPHLVPAMPTPRPSVAKLYHAGYDDVRPTALKQAKLWSFNQRPCLCETWLTPLQVASVLALALDHDVIAQRTHGQSERLVPLTKPNLIINHLLGQFLDAVLLGYLKPQLSEATA